MITVEFLQAILPSEGLICIGTYPHKSPTHGRDIMYHKTFTSASDAARFAASQMMLFDVYFGCFTYRELVEKTSKSGQKYMALERTAANALLCRVLYMDLDVGTSTATDRKYATQAEAFAALREFCRQTGLPRPFVVNSGRGLHVYWRLAEALTVEAWLALSTTLKAVAAHFGLLCDARVTADAARVLRIVGTWNRKDPANPLRVTAGPLPPEVPVAEIRATLEHLSKLLPAPEVVQAVSWKPEDLPTPKALAQECATFATMASSAPTAGEGVWFATLQLLRHTTGGSVLSHKLSALHPDYSHQETQAKLDRLEAMNMGPSTCGTLQVLLGDASPCPACPHFGLPNSSPVVFARRVPDTKLPDDVPPPIRPYSRTKRGIEYQPMPTVDVPVPPPATVIYPYDFYPRDIIDDPLNKLKRIEWVASVPIRGEITVILGIDAYTQEDKMVATLANQGVTVDKRHARLMGGYVSHYIAQLQAARAEQRQLSTMGWVEGTDCKEFLHGSTIITADGTRPGVIAPSVNNAAQGMTRKGTLARQVAAMSFYEHPAYMPQQVFICASLAAPLLYLTRHHGVLFNLSGDPGASKSSAMAVCGGFLGDPQKTVLNGTASGFTPKARMLRLETLACIALLLDETTNMPPEAVKEMALAVTQPGRRVTAQANQTETTIPDTVKSTLMMSTSNNSMHSLLALNNAAGSAGSMRLIEMLVKHNGIHTKQEADAFLIEIQENYGHIGPEFIRTCIREIKTIERTLQRIKAEMEERANIQPSERFWSAGLCLAVLGADIARSKGLLPYDPVAMMDWCVNVQIPLMRGIVNETYLTPMGVLQMFMAENSNNILVLSSQINTPKMVVDRHPRGEVVGRLESERRTLWIAPHAFRKFCEVQKLNFDSTVRSLIAHGVMARDKLDLARYVDGYEVGHARVLRIDLGHHEMTGLAPIVSPDGAQIIVYPAGKGVARGAA